MAEKGLYFWSVAVGLDRGALAGGNCAAYLVCEGRRWERVDGGS